MLYVAVRPSPLGARLKWAVNVLIRFMTCRVCTIVELGAISLHATLALRIAVPCRGVKTSETCPFFFFFFDV